MKRRKRKKKQTIWHGNIDKEISTEGFQYFSCISFAFHTVQNSKSTFPYVRNHTSHSSNPLLNSLKYSNRTFIMNFVSFPFSIRQWNVSSTLSLSISSFSIALTLLRKWNIDFVQSCKNDYLNLLLYMFFNVILFHCWIITCIGRASIHQ